MLLALLAGAGCERATPIERLGVIEARRDADARYLRRALAGPSAGIRARAARTAGRIQSASFVDPLVPLLADDDPAVRIEAAFALGRIADRRRDLGPRIASHLVHALRHTPILPEAPAAEMVTAIGKARAPQHDRVLAEHVHDLRPAVAGAAMLAWAARGFAMPDSEIVEMMDRPQPELRWRGLYAAGRRAPPHLLVRLAAPELADTVAVVREMAARALARSDMPREAAALVVRHLSSEIDAPVMVAMLRTLGALADPAGLDVAVRYLDSPWPEVRAAAARAVTHDARVTERMAGSLLAAASDREAAVRAAVAAALAPVADPYAQAALRTLATDPEPLVREAAVRALPGAGRHEASLPIVVAALDDESVRVACAALDALSALDPEAARAHAFDRLEWDAVGYVVGAIDVLADLAVAHGRAGARARMFADRYAASARPPVKAALVRAIARTAPERPCLLAPAMRDPLPGVRAMAYRAIAPGHTRGLPCVLPPTDRVLRATAVGRPRGYPDTDRLPVRAEIVTTRGTIVVRLFGRDAPLTVAHVTALARAGAYDGATVHFSQSDSVTAFGCPRGDGLGDLGRTVPAEIGRRPMARGAVALLIDEATGAGDSRIFIALRPLPELDGAHAVFGTVVRGLHRARRAAGGERIEAVIVE